MNSTTSGQPRLLNLEEFAALIRKMREVFQWSQETLAELAGLNVRTVQRVENAKSASLDTRRALAGAFEIEDIDAFNKPYIIPTEEELKEGKARFDRDYITLPALPLSTGHQLAKLAEGSTVDICQPGFEIKRDPQAREPNLLAVWLNRDQLGTNRKAISSTRRCTKHAVEGKPLTSMQ